MNKLYTLEQYYMLRQLEERVKQEPTSIDVNIDGESRKFDLGPRWDFYIAFADYAHEHEVFQSLIDDDLIQPMQGKPRIHDDWRKHFPEYRWRITELGQKVLAEPYAHVERTHVDFRHKPDIPPDVG